jgi:hypothetical protein
MNETTVRRQAGPAPAGARLGSAAGIGPSSVTIADITPHQDPLPATFTVSGTLTPCGGTVYGHLWDATGNELAGAAANPNANSDPMTGGWALPFNILVAQVATYTLKIVFLDGQDPCSTAQQIQVGPAMSPAPVKV